MPQHLGISQSTHGSPQPLQQCLIHLLGADQSWFFLSKMKRKSQKRKDGGWEQAHQETRTARSVCQDPSPRTAQLSPQADFNIWDNGHFWLYLFVGFLFPEPDIGGFRSTSLKTPELQMLHMVWKKVPKSGWSTVIKPTPSKHRGKPGAKSPH